MIMDLEASSDYALVLAVSRWEPLALKEIYRRYGAAVFGVARRVLQDDAYAQDVTQETFLDMWNHPQKFDPERGSLRAYLLVRTHGRSVDMVRSEQARRAREERYGTWEAPATGDLEAEMLDLIRGERVREALARLDEKESEPIRLAYFSGLTYRQVADALGEPEGTVKSRIRTGMRRLRTTLEDARRT